ncbi:hypothetical protein N8307_10375 [Planktomarina temperata]|nr:hypothetical protein [Planktomarina temperata]
MDPHVTGQLEELGCVCLSDISGLLATYELDEDVRCTLIETSAALMASVADINIDWLRFYERSEFECNGLFFQCAEFSSVGLDTPSFAVNRASLGNAGAMLERAGLDDFAILVRKLREGIRVPPTGMGNTTILELWQSLTKLAKSVRHDPSVLKQYSQRYPSYSSTSEQKLRTTVNQAVVQQNSQNELSELALSLDIGVLHIGPKTEKFRSRGVFTVRKLLSLSDKEILSWAGMGRSTTSRIQESVEALKVAQTTEGDINWDIYCEQMQLTLLPKQILSQTMSETILLLSPVIEETVLAGETEENRLILENRIMKQPAERMTLEAISELMPIKITRERVRQKEAKILQKLSSALIYNDYSQSQYHFRPEFTAPWNKAAEQFASSEDEISLTSLVEGLESAWGVSRDVFSEQLPLITAIITGDLASGDEFKRTLPVEMPLLLQGSGLALELPLKRLQIGKAANSFAENSINTVGDFLNAIATGDVKIGENKASKTTHEQISMLAHCVEESGEINWPQYAQDAGVPDLPAYRIETPQNFLESIIPTGISALKARQISAKAPDIFKLRTSVGLATRPTADAMAEQLGGFGSTIKLVETKLLKFLNEVFVEGNVALARAHIDEEFLSYWAIIDAAFTKFDGDVEYLVQDLCEKWDIAKNELDKHTPAIIAIMTGYPMGRLGRYSKVARKTVSSPRRGHLQQLRQAKKNYNFVPRMVSLRGFRRVH